MNTATSHASHADWLGTAIRCIEADYQRSADTHLIALPLPAFAAQARIEAFLRA